MSRLFYIVLCIFTAVSAANSVSKLERLRSAKQLYELLSAKVIQNILNLIHVKLV